MNVIRRRGGRYARQQARDRHIELVREQIKPITSVVFGSYAAIVGLHVLTPTRFGGVILGVTLTIPIWLITLAVMTDPSAAAWATGAETEDWTSTELRRACGRDAVVIDDVQFGHTNADHVIIGAFGVVVVETKWSSNDWASPRGYKVMEVAAKQARDGARRISRVLRDNGISIPVDTLVVVWGGRANHWPEGSCTRTVANATVVAGPAIAEWAETIRGIAVVPTDKVGEIENLIRATR